MLTKLNLYDGVPIGTDNFQKFIDEIISSVKSTLEFTHYAYDGVESATNGGSLSTNPLVLKRLNDQPIYVLSSEANGREGVAYVKTPDSYVRFNYPFVNSFDELPVHEWEILATDFTIEQQSAIYSNDYAKNNFKLPTRSIGMDKSGNPIYGFYSLRYNGVPQEHNTSLVEKKGYKVELNVKKANSRLQLSKLSLGAEYPHPVINGRYVRTLDYSSNGISFEEIYSMSDNGLVELEFPYTNFNIDNGSHILLRRRFDDPSIKPVFVYVPMDNGSGPIKDGSYRVKDKSRGIITLRLTRGQIEQLNVDNRINIESNIRFHIISAEQLLEELSETSVNYKSRYGATYDGIVADTELVTLTYSRGSYVVSPPFQSNVGSDSTSKQTLYEGTVTEFNNSVVLGIRYNTVASSINADTQKDRHRPDTITALYSEGIFENDVNANGGVSNVYGFIDFNKCSWYNWDINNYEYSPVARAEQVGVSLGFSNELSADHIPFKPTERILRFEFTKPEFKYGHTEEVSVGTLDKFVRADATIPEPHHIHAPMLKEHIQKDFYIPAGEQMIMFGKAVIDGTMIIDGTFVVL